jgi:hypothetical protein
MSTLKGPDGQFAGRHSDRVVTIHSVRWYLRYKLRLRDLVEMMTERGLSLNYTTVLHWVQFRTSPTCVGIGIEKTCISFCYGLRTSVKSHGLLLATCLPVDFAH